MAKVDMYAILIIRYRSILPSTKQKWHHAVCILPKIVCEFVLSFYPPHGKKEKSRVSKACKRAWNMRVIAIFWIRAPPVPTPCKIILLLW